MGARVPSRKSNSETGRIGETLARQHLENHGYQVVERNWRCQEGEIDLVARQGGDWVFVEVKARRGDRFGAPEEAVTPAKQQRLLRCGLMYLAEHDLGDVSWRIDVVAIELSAKNQPVHIRVYKNAVDAAGPLE